MSQLTISPLQKDAASGLLRSMAELTKGVDEHTRVVLVQLTDSLQSQHGIKPEKHNLKAFIAHGEIDSKLDKWFHIEV